MVSATLAGALFLAVLVPGALSEARSAPAAYSVVPEDIGPSQLVAASLYKPNVTTPNQSIALVVGHQIPIAAEIPCAELAQRGFTIVCTQETGSTWDQLAMGMGYGVSYARSLPGISHVVLLGWSGGGAQVAYYQNVAENGVRVCQAPTRLDPCSKSLAGLPRADGVIFLDAIPGLAFSFMSALDASAVVPAGLTSQTKTSEYLFNPANGYNPNPNESSNYSSSFTNAYTQAQARREAALVSAAETLVRRGAQSGATRFPVARDAARIWQQETSLLSHTQDRHPLITPTTPTGTVQVVRSVRLPSDSPIPSSPQANGGAPAQFTANTFLSTSAIKAPHYRLTADSIEGVDWASSNTSTVVNVQGITAPMIMLSMTAHYWVVPSEMYYRAAKSHNKTLAYIEGAEHVFTPCMTCASTPGEFGDTQSEVFNYVSNWLQKVY
jgi:hypothetical protein